MRKQVKGHVLFIIKLNNKESYLDSNEIIVISYKFLLYIFNYLLIPIRNQIQSCELVKVNHHRDKATVNNEYPDVEENRIAYLFGIAKLEVVVNNDKINKELD
jgi:hypothetical protein